MKKVISIILLIAAATGLSAQTEFGHISYRELGNTIQEGRAVAYRTDHANLDTLTSVLTGTFAYDTINSVLVQYNGASWVDVGGGGGGSLDDAYNEGKIITADGGAVKIEGEDGLLVTGVFGSGESSEWVGAGAVMFFNPKKAAIRAGLVESDIWDDVNLGQYSSAFGVGNEASGSGSFGTGARTVASGAYSFSSGFQTEASGGASLAFGYESIASGAEASAFGYFTTSRSFSETAIGVFNTDYTPTSVDSWSGTDRLFVIGNGQSDVSRSDALLILKDGTTTLGGSLAIIDGTEGDGYVFTSDGSGNGSWVDPNASSARQSTARNDTATTGSSADIPDVSNYIIDTGAALASYSLVFPSSPTDGQVLWIIASNGTSIASLTLSSVSQTINNLTTTLTSSGVRYIYHVSNGTWYKSN